jgi:chromosome partitioning protein
MPAKIIVFCNVKGGPGKTTLAINVAATLAQKAKVAVVDADPQQSAVKYDSDALDGKSLPMPVVGYPEEKINRTLRKLIGDYDYIIVDTPPSSLAISNITRSALIPADLAVVPLVPSPMVIRETILMSALFEEINDLRESSGAAPLASRLLINRYDPRKTLNKQLPDALDNIPIEQMKTKVREREAFNHAALDGCSVHETRVSGWKEASEDILQLSDEIRKIVG